MPGEEIEGESQEELVENAQETDNPQEKDEPLNIKDLELENSRRQIKELQEYKDKYLRQLAESENFRKRMQKEKQELTQYAIQNLILDFLSPIDHMENALKFTEQMSEEVKHWGIGFQMILNQFKEVLTNNNVRAFKSVGEHFDPYRHEAIEAVFTTEYEPDTVIEESARGYIMGDKIIIRPARVKVAKAPKEGMREEIKQEGVESEQG